MVRYKPGELCNYLILFSFKHPSPGFRYYSLLGVVVKCGAITGGKHILAVCGQCWNKPGKIVIVGNGSVTGAGVAAMQTKL